MYTSRKRPADKDNEPAEKVAKAGDGGAEGGGGAGGVVNIISESKRLPDFNTYHQHVKFSSVTSLTNTPKILLPQLGFPWLMRPAARAIHNKIMGLYNAFRLHNITIKVFNMVPYAEELSSAAGGLQLRSTMNQQDGYLEMKFNNNTCQSHTSFLYNDEGASVPITYDPFTTLVPGPPPATRSASLVTLSEDSTILCPLNNPGDSYWTWTTKHLQNQDADILAYSKKAGVVVDTTMVAQPSNVPANMKKKPPISLLRDRNFITQCAMSQNQKTYKLPSTPWIPKNVYYYDAASVSGGSFLSRYPVTPFVTPMSIFDIASNGNGTDLAQVQWCTYASHNNPWINTDSNYAALNTYHGSNSREYDMLATLLQVDETGKRLKNFITCQVEVSYDIEYIMRDNIPLADMGTSDAASTHLSYLSLPPTQLYSTNTAAITEYEFIPIC